MSDYGFIMLAIFGGACAGVITLGLVLLFAPKPTIDRRSPIPDNLAEPRHFVFRNGYLVDHSENVGFLMSTPVDHLKAWDELLDALSNVADGVPDAFATLNETGRAFRLDGTFGRDRVHVIGARDGDDLRITVASMEQEQTSMRIDIESLKVVERDLALLTRSSDTSPTLSWVTDAKGSVIWSNEAYLTLAADCIGADATRGWPLAELFPIDTNSTPGTVRRKVVARDGSDRWFDVSTVMSEANGHRHMHALKLNEVIAAEDSLRAFIQTLTKTFAYLPTGLAIFDRDKSLAMFNPALMDMTGLDGAWLSRKPKLSEFFDALRDHRKLPEPRNYKAWRDGLTDLSRVGASGTYTETWTLPDGKTYCVTGRPHADGAVALMLEDISENISLTRIQTDERRAMHGALDAVEEAMVVFASNGRCIAANDAAQDMLADPETGTLPGQLDECIAIWNRTFLPNPAWGDLRSFVRGDGNRHDQTPWTEDLRRDGFCDVTLRVVPTSGGGLTLCFAEDRELAKIPAAVHLKQLAEPVS